MPRGSGFITIPQKRDSPPLPYPQCVASRCHQKKERAISTPPSYRGSSRAQLTMDAHRNKKPKPLWVLLVYVSAREKSFSGELRVSPYDLFGFQDTQHHIQDTKEAQCCVQIDHPKIQILKCSKTRKECIPARCLKMFRLWLQGIVENAFNLRVQNAEVRGSWV